MLNGSPEAGTRRGGPVDKDTRTREHRISAESLEPRDGVHKSKRQQTPRFCVTVFDSSGFCGEAGIGSLDSMSRQCHVNYWADSARSGLSYGAETLALLCDFAFVSLRLHRVVAEILPANRASLKTAARVGFIDEGTARRIYLKDGQCQDYEIFALSSEDWPTLESSVLL